MAIGGGDGSSKASAITVETLEDLLQANTDNSGKYIKVLNDINPANEPSYTGSITSAQASYKNYIYADTPKTISGLVVVGNAFIMTPNNTPSTFEQINFINCVFKATSTSSVLFRGYNSSYPLNLNKCTISIRCQISGYDSTFYVYTNGTSITNCSVYVQNSIKGNSGSALFQPSASNAPTTNSNFVFENFYVTGYTSESTNMWNYYTSSCAFVWKNCTFTGTKLFNSNSSSYDHAIQTYHAFTGCTFPSGQQVVRCTKSNAVACDSDTSTTGSNYPFTPYTGTPASLVVLCTLSEDGEVGFSESLKDKQYLLDTGFLP